MREIGSEKKKVWATCIAALWSSLFALLHIAWAAGWYVGLPAQEAQQAFERTWFFVYNLIAAVLCAIAVIVAVKLAPTRRKSPSRFLIILAWCGTIILTLRGGASIVKIIFLASAGKSILEWTLLWEIWFCLGAILFWLAIRQSGSAENKTGNCRTSISK